jgi:hypothetical protein
MQSGKIAQLYFLGRLYNINVKVFDFSNTFLLKQLSIFPLPSFICYIAIALNGHFKQWFSIKISRYCFGWLFRDNGHTFSNTSVRMTCVIECFPYFVHLFVVRFLLLSMDGQRWSTNGYSIKLLVYPCCFLCSANFFAPAAWKTVHAH